MLSQNCLAIEYITHPLHVAILLADLEAEEKLIYGGMFCDVLKKTAGKVQYLFPYTGLYLSFKIT